ncbi:MAG: hypothetical protein WBA91_12410 [Paracoccaceae bacterium]
MGRKRNKIALIATVTTLWPTFASPQQGGIGANTGGLQIDFGIANSLKADSNFALAPGNPGRSIIADSKLTFGLSSIQQNSQLTIGASGVLRWADIPGRSIKGFEDQIVNFRYQTDSYNSRLVLDGRYRNVDREFLDPFAVEKEALIFPTLTSNGGNLRETNLGVSYDTGLAAPLGLSISLRHFSQDYSNVVSPSLFDTETNYAKIGARLNLSPITTARLSVAQTDYSASDLVSTDRRTREYAVGLTHELDQTLTLDTMVGITDVDTFGIPGASSSGLVGSVGLTKALPDGQIYGTVASSRNQNGLRTTLTFGRDIVRATSSLKASLGVTEGQSSNSSVIGSLTYDKQLANGNFTATLDRSSSTNGLNQDILDTRIGLGYGYALTSTSLVDLRFNWGQSQGEGSSLGIPTIETANVTASYSRAINNGWSMTGGVTLRKRSETGVGNADSSALFLTLDRNFSFRP